MHPARAESIRLCIRLNRLRPHAPGSRSPPRPPPGTPTPSAPTRSISRPATQSSQPPGGRTFSPARGSRAQKPRGLWPAPPRAAQPSGPGRVCERASCAKPGRATSRPRRVLGQVISGEVEERGWWLAGEAIASMVHGQVFA
ncbi:hypothetical protein BC628DRAFT_377757 [Trametes gibbosa]|nr:hypothetical protein BC628DRAFT_377757 [Trametes gibbosa]